MPVICRQIDPIGRIAAIVGQRGRQAKGRRRRPTQATIDRVAPDRGAGERRRRRCRNIVKARADHIVRKCRGDRLVHLDIEVVHANRQARDDLARGENRADRERIGLFRPDRRIAATRCVRLTGGRGLDRPDRARTRTLRDADCREIGIGCRCSTDAGFGCQVGQTCNNRREQFADVRCTNGTLVVTAEADTLYRLPRRTTFKSGRVEAWAASRLDFVGRVADAGFEGQVVEERLVRHERRDQLAKCFLDVVSAREGQRRAAGTTECRRILRERIGDAIILILAIFRADRIADRLIGRRQDAAEVTGQNRTCLIQFGIDANCALRLQEACLCRADGTRRTEQIERDAIARRIEARRCIGGVQRLLDALRNDISRLGRCLLAATIGCRNIEARGFRDIDFRPDPRIVQTVLVRADARPDFNEAAIDAWQGKRVTHRTRRRRSWLNKRRRASLQSTICR